MGDFESLRLEEKVKMATAATTTIEETKATMPTRSEDILSQKWDNCVVNTSVKLAGGLVIGSVFSLLFFKRRMWPITFGVGSGFGMGYADCERELNAPLKKWKLR